MEERTKHPLKARLLLTFGGVFGFHRLYLEQIPEAFIYFSTFGVFGIGTFLDIFRLNSLVDAYNDRIKGDQEEFKIFKNAKVQPKLSRLVRGSIDQFICSVAYSMWLGFLCWIAGTITFGQTFHQSIVMISAVGAAVSAGIYVVGNREGESRDLLYIWMSTVCGTFIFGMLDTSVFRALLVSALIGTVIGNRTAQVRPPSLKQHNTKHFVFWSSLFLCLLCIIAVGTSRHILQQKVSVTKDGEVTLVSSVDVLVQNRITNMGKVRKFFKDAIKIEYKRVTPEKKSSNSWWDVDLVGRAPSWADHVTAVIVDVLRAEARNAVGNLKMEPLQWALWRQYLILYFETSAFASDRTLTVMCARYESDMKDKPKAEDTKSFYSGEAVKRACEAARL